ncbi:aldo/keto reductase [Plantactinospora endophytica]|uniref:Aldo/keto reductase n=1 Tax=Plantactinospora endophytica TaxID=673535 RepID=A0ABQ4EEQ8_9ACTN|nr:aldo/keto reductase [Plantactinospora endophytica]GIG93206.1 aldo/keto reductase [Plantactinospora endophytica]
MSLDSYLTLGRSGLRVSPFALGAMNFGVEGGWGCGVEESEQILQAYLDRGGNFVDTANFYTNGHSEAILGDFFAARPGLRDRVVLASKFFGNLYPGDPNGGGAGRKAIVAQLDQTLRRMKTDYLDVYWLHNWDAHTPVEETMRTLDGLVTAGKIRYVGFSNTPAWYTAQAHTMAVLRSWTPVIALQVEYSLLARTVEGELVPLARDAGMGLTPWSPLAGGFLSGKYSRGAEVHDTMRGRITGGPTDAQFAVIDVLTTVAAEVEASPAAVALAWLRSRPMVTAPILGPRRLAHLDANLAALDVRLSDQQIAALDEASAPRLNYPYDLNRQTGAMLQFGGSTVDGVPSTVYPPLLQDSTRY